MEANLATIIARNSQKKQREAKHNPGAVVKRADDIGLLLQQHLKVNFF